MTQKKSSAPRIAGAAHATIALGTVFNPLTGVTATDIRGTDITSRIIVTGSMPTTLGVHKLVYTVTDDRGRTATVTRTVNVQPQHRSSNAQQSWMLYSLRNPATGGHLITPNIYEAQAVYNSGWQYEGCKRSSKLP